MCPTSCLTDTVQMHTFILFETGKPVQGSSRSGPQQSTYPFFPTHPHTHMYQDRNPSLWELKVYLSRERFYHLLALSPLMTLYCFWNKIPMCYIMVHSTLMSPSACSLPPGTTFPEAPDTPALHTIYTPFSKHSSWLLPLFFAGISPLPQAHCSDELLMSKCPRKHQLLCVTSFSNSSKQI